MTGSGATGDPWTTRGSIRDLATRSPINELYVYDTCQTRVRLGGGMILRTPSRSYSSHQLREVERCSLSTIDNCRSTELSIATSWDFWRRFEERKERKSTSASSPSGSFVREISSSSVSGSVRHVVEQVVELSRHGPIHGAHPPSWWTAQ